MSSNLLETSLDDVRDRIKQFKPTIKQLHSMAELEVINPATFRVAGKNMTITKNAMKGLCDQLDMPPRFYSKLYSKNKDAWGNLIKVLSRQTQKPVCLIAAKGNIIAVVENTADITKHDEVLDTTAFIMKHEPSYKLRKVEFNGVELNIHLIHTASFDVGKWNGNADPFRIGIHMSNSIVDGFTGQELIERMRCTNLTYVAVDGVSTHKNIHDIEKMPDFALEFDRNGFADLLKRKITGLKKYNASIEELVDVGRLFKIGNENRPYMKEYSGNLRLGEISSNYGINSEDELNAKPVLWKQTAKTPFILYDLFNYVTEIARHDKRLSQNEATEFRMKGGELLFEPPDLASIAELRNISKEPWVLSSNN